MEMRLEYQWEIIDIAYLVDPECCYRMGQRLWETLRGQGERRDTNAVLRFVDKLEASDEEFNYDNVPFYRFQYSFKMK